MSYEKDSSEALIFGWAEVPFSNISTFRVVRLKAVFSVNPI
jgi:hypothetical protein